MNITFRNIMLTIAFALMAVGLISHLLLKRNTPDQPLVRQLPSPAEQMASDNQQQQPQQLVLLSESERLNTPEPAPVAPAPRERPVTPEPSQSTPSAPSTPDLMANAERPSGATALNNPTLEIIESPSPEPEPQPAPAPRAAPAPKPEPVVVAKPKPEPPPAPTPKPEPKPEPKSEPVRTTPQRVEQAVAMATTPRQNPSATAAPSSRTTTRVLDTGWVLQQPKQRFTIQLVASYSRSEIESLATSISTREPVAIYETRYNGRPWFALTYGDFDSAEQARQGITSLPSRWQQNKPWPRSFGALEQTIRSRS